MAVSTDPLQREQIGVAAQDTGARFRAPDDNSLLALSRSLAEVQPALNATLNAVSQQKQADAEAQARTKAVETSGAQLADAVRMGTIKPTQNPWFIQAYNREAAAIRATDQLSKLQADSQSWAERADPVAFAKKWREQVAGVAQGYEGDPDQAKGFLPAEAQVTQQVLATNQSYNSQRIEGERMQNLAVLASDSLQRAVQAAGGHITGVAAAQALEPAKQQWIATGGSLDDWNKIAISAVTTASYSIRSPQLRMLTKSPSLLNPQAQDDTIYGDGTDATTPDLPEPLKPVEAPQAQPAPAPQGGPRLVPPAMGRVTNTFQQHLSRGSAGVDIAVPMGTKLTTPVGGTAEVGFQKGKGGLFVKVVSPDGKVEQVLAHLSSASVQNGQKVAPGSVVGLSGKSGDATGPHVHWQLKIDGKQVDPFGYHPALDAAPQSAPVPQEVAAGEAAPTILAPAPAVQTTTAPQHPLGPSLYDIPGEAQNAEQDAYRIQQSVQSGASDKLQAITAQRKLDALGATDRLYTTFGTKLLSGDIPQSTIVSTLSAAGYSPQVIAGALDNVQNAVSTSSTLATARATLQAAPGTPGARQIFQMETEGRISGYTPDYEQRVAGMVASGQISADDGSRWVGEAVSRSESLQSQGRAQKAFEEAQADRGTPGQLIKKAGDLRRGVDAYTSQAILLAQRYAQGAGGFSGTGTLSAGTQRVLKTSVSHVVMNWLVDHPNDWAGAEKAGRDAVARFLTNLMALHQSKQGSGGGTKPAPSSASSSGNPRG